MPRPADPDDDAFLGSVHLAVSSKALAGVARASPWQFLQAVEVELSAPFPLNLVFTREVLAAYTKLFRLLALVHFALHCAKGAWLQIRRLVAAAGDMGEAVPTSLLALRHQVHFFATTLQRFCLIDVMAVEFRRLEARVAGAESLEAVLSAHEGFLEASTTKCFLGEGSGELLGTVAAMLEHGVG